MAKVKENEDSEITAHPCHTKCEVCHQTDARYRCPSCLVQTCSLQCVREHKASSGCDGVRNNAEYVPVKKFTDRHLFNDYRFLEEGARKVSNALRDPLKWKRSNITRSTIKLRQRARSRGINLILMPCALSRHRQNTSQCAYNMKILWHIQWYFPASDVTVISERVHEDTTLQCAVDRYVHPTESDPIMRHRLQAYSSDNHVAYELVLKAEGETGQRCAPRQRRFYLLDKNQTLGENLQGHSIIEFPVINVVLHSHLHEYSIDMKGRQLQT